MGWLSVEQRVHRFCVSRISPRLTTTVGDTVRFRQGRRLLHELLTVRCVQKPQRLKGNKKPSWLCYFHMVSLHMGQPHILSSGPFWPSHSLAQNQRVTLCWPSAPPGAGMTLREKSLQIILFLLVLMTCDITLAWPLASHQGKSCFFFFPQPSKLTVDSRATNPVSPRKLYQSCFSFLTNHFPFCFGINQEATAPSCCCC